MSGETTGIGATALVTAAAIAGLLASGCGSSTPGTGATLEPAVNSPASVGGMTDGPNVPEMVRLAGGTFEMGSDNGASVHSVSVAAFEMSRSEVTVAAFRACVEARVCDAPGTGNLCNWDVPGRDTHPINCVSWTQARTFATWLGLRLPTEAEWEFAARGGGRPVDYPWGDDGPDCTRANMLGCAGRTQPVCTTPAGNTPDGLCDMAGNVWEWVEDDYHGDYTGAPDDGSVWLDDPRGDNRVLRGGSFDFTGGFVRAAFRSWSNPQFRGNGVGFRVVVSPFRG